MLGRGKGLRPAVTLHLKGRGNPQGYQESFAFPRHWGAIIFLAVFDIIFLIPVFTTFQQAQELWQQTDSLFNVIVAMFLTFWLLGWSLAPLIMTALLLIMLFGRETIRAKPGELAIELGLPLVGLRMHYKAAHIRNLRMEEPAKKSGKSWRRSHIAFDYGPGQGQFGIGLAAASLDPIRERIETVTGVKIGSGPAPAEELTVEPEIPGALEPDAMNRATSDELLTTDQPLNLKSPSSLVLVAANIVPLVGAVFWNWDMGLLMLLYWAESAVIGFFNVCKIIVIGKWMAPGIAIFFLAHFGGFMAIHFLFLYNLFLQDGGSSDAAGDDLKQVAVLFIGLWPALLALFISHGFSFFHNFIGRGEYRQRSIRQQMAEPYSRIIFMHLVIIFGGALSMALGEIAPVIMGVIVLKTGFDLRAHLKQHSKDLNQSPVD